MSFSNHAGIFGVKSGKVPIEQSEIAFIICNVGLVM